MSQNNPNGIDSIASVQSVFIFKWEGYSIIVDMEDGWLLEYHFSNIRKQGYPRLNVRAVELNFGKDNGGKIDLHRYLLKALPGQIIDHIDGNPLNNRKENLRFVTAHQNSMNRGDTKNRLLPKGVFIRKANKHSPYVAGIRFMGTYTHLGSFSTIEEAKAAYDKAADFYFGQFNRANGEQK